MATLARPSWVANAFSKSGNYAIIYNPMSKLGRKPIAIPSDIEARLADGIFYFKGKAGQTELKVLPYLEAKLQDQEITVKPVNNIRQARANWGTMVSLIKNAIAGVSEGFSKELQIEGIGYRASIEGDKLNLSIGFSHPVKYQPPTGVKISVEKNIIKISGIDKQLVGLAASQIRKLKKPEPYQGKGIRYVGEVIRRKAGKKAAAAAGAAA